MFTRFFISCLVNGWVSAFDMITCLSINFFGFNISFVCYKCEWIRPIFPLGVYV